MIFTVSFLLSSFLFMEFLFLPKYDFSVRKEKKIHFFLIAMTDSIVIKFHYKITCRKIINLLI